MYKTDYPADIYNLLKKINKIIILKNATQTLKNATISLTSLIITNIQRQGFKNT